MGRIQSDVGLITGVQIGKTIESLMAIAARPRDAIKTRTEALQKEQVAITELSALLASIQYVAKNVGKADLYKKLKVTSSNESALSASISGTPTAGNYQVTPVRVARYQQYLTGGYTSDSQPLGAGKFTFRFGDNVQRNANLETLGGSGSGFVRGKIRITDRSGASAEVDLSAATSMDEVLDAINSAAGINVTASAQGDRIRLEDRTGLTMANLKVQEVGRGTTAASLGLAGIDVSTDTAAGQDMVRLTAGTLLSELNDGAGVEISTALPDIAYQLRDGTTGTIDLSPIAEGSSTVSHDATLGQVLDRINAAAPGKLKVEIAADGERLVVTDLTSGEGTLSLSAMAGSGALADLGLAGAAVNDTITGRRLMGGLQTVLLSSLNGGKGFGDLGQIQLTDRSGATVAIDLSSAETLDDVIAAVNASGLGISARVNDARNGIQLTDTTGQTGAHLVVADADATQAATQLGLVADVDRSSVNSGNLHLRVVSMQTRLSTLNGGAGVARGRFTITNSQGQSASVDLSGEGYDTVGDVVRAINRLSLDVTAEMNATGDGIRLVDRSGGSGSLRVADSGATSAKDLHLTRSSENTTLDGQPVQTIDGSITETITLDADDGLADLRSKIAAAGAGLSTQILTDTSARPYRMILSSQRPGRAGQLVIDSSQLEMSLTETARGQDALLMLGSSGSGSQVLLTSTSNQFTNAVSGVKLEIKAPSDSPVTVQISTTDTDLVANVKTLVDNYNKFRKKLKEYTSFNETTGEGNVLTGDSAALRLDNDLSHLFSNRLSGAGSIRTVSEVGISLNDDGTLQFDESKLKNKYASDPQAVQDFFTKADVGLSAKLDRLLEGLAGVDTSLLGQRLKSLDKKIQDNQERFDFLSKRLDAQQERLYLQFYRMEQAIAKLQNQLQVINSIQPITTTTSSSSSSG